MSQAQSLVINDRSVECPMCGYDRFWTRQTLMNSRGASFFGFDWANRTATNYVCDECGYVLWFLQKS